MSKQTRRGNSSRRFLVIKEGGRADFRDLLDKNSAFWIYGTPERELLKRGFSQEEIDWAKAYEETNNESTQI